VEPFDRRLESPISRVLELRASARDSVVVAGGMTDLQLRMLVDTGLEARVIEAATAADPPALIVISGSAGGGKSAAISQIATLAEGIFADVVEDATHADAPGEEQRDRLLKFFEPLRDGAPAYSAKPLAVAMNTGMVIQFFDQLRERGEHPLTALEADLRGQLGLPPSQSEAHLPGRILVINLDLRSTSGGEASLFQSMLAALDPDDERGVLAGAPRCGTCVVRDWLASEISLARGRPLQPRALWDLAADMVTGGEPFTESDPCDRIAAIAERGERALVWWRLLPNGAFVDPHGDAARALHELDPSYAPDAQVHDILAGAGIEPETDAAALENSLGGSGREAVQPAASALRAGQTAPDLPLPELVVSRASVGRGLVRAALLGGGISATAGGLATFRAALTEYAGDLSTSGKLDDLKQLLATALVRAFGVETDAETFFHTRAYDPRRQHAVLVRADLLGDPRLLALVHPDPAWNASPHGAKIAGYEPLAVTFDVAGVELRIDLPLYRLLELTAAGTKPSSADLERFFALRQAAESLGRRIAVEHDRPLLIVARAAERRFRLAQNFDVAGNAVHRVQEIVT
jgi:hypothetical protein